MLLAKPETFMNLSGVAVRELLREYEGAPESHYEYDRSRIVIGDAIRLGDVDRNHSLCTFRATIEVMAAEPAAASSHLFAAHTTAQPRLPRPLQS